MSSKNKDDKWKKFTEEQAEQPSTEFELEPESESVLDYPSHEKLEGELNEVEQQLNEYKDKLLRSQAEVQNIRQRAERDIQNAHRYGSERLINDILPVVDSLERGLQNGADNDPMREGLQLTLGMLEKALVKHGVEIINPKVGEGFNPEHHQAMSMQQDDKAKANTILSVMQRGFMLNGRVLRAAMVVVAS